MDEWLDSLSFFFFFFSPLFLFFLSLLAWADICVAELATWGVGPDVYTPSKGKIVPRNVMDTPQVREKCVHAM